MFKHFSWQWKHRLGHPTIVEDCLWTTTRYVNILGNQNLLEFGAFILFECGIACFEMSYL